VRQALPIPLLPEGRNRKAGEGDAVHWNYKAQPEPLFVSSFASEEGRW